MSFFNDSREEQWFHKDATNRVNRSHSRKRIWYIFSTLIASYCETSEKIVVRTEFEEGYVNKEENANFQKKKKKEFAGEDVFR